MAPAGRHTARGVRGNPVRPRGGGAFRDAPAELSSRGADPRPPAGGPRRQDAREPRHLPRERDALRRDERRRRENARGRSLRGTRAASRHDGVAAQPALHAARLPRGGASAPRRQPRQHPPAAPRRGKTGEIPRGASDRLQQRMERRRARRPAGAVPLAQGAVVGSRAAAARRRRRRPGVRPVLRVHDFSAIPARIPSRAAGRLAQGAANRGLARPYRLLRRRLSPGGVHPAARAESLAGAAVPVGAGGHCGLLRAARPARARRRHARRGVGGERRPPARRAEQDALRSGVGGARGRARLPARNARARRKRPAHRRQRLGQDHAPRGAVAARPARVLARPRRARLPAAVRLRRLGGLRAAVAPLDAQPRRGQDVGGGAPRARAAARRPGRRRAAAARRLRGGRGRHGPAARGA